MSLNPVDFKKLFYSLFKFNIPLLYLQRQLKDSNLVGLIHLSGLSHYPNMTHSMSSEQSFHHWTSGLVLKIQLLSKNLTRKQLKAEHESRVSTLKIEPSLFRWQGQDPIISSQMVSMLFLPRLLLLSL